MNLMTDVEYYIFKLINLKTLDFIPALYMLDHVIITLRWR